MIPSINEQINSLSEGKSQKVGKNEKAHIINSAKSSTVHQKKLEINDDEMNKDIHEYSSCKNNNPGIFSERNHKESINQAIGNSDEDQRKRKAIVNKILFETGSIFSPKKGQGNSNPNTMNYPDSLSLRTDKNLKIQK